MLKKQYLKKYQSSILETWHHSCPSQKKQTDALSAVVITTLSALVSFCPKKESSICNLLSETKGPTWNRHSSHIVLTPINRLCRVDGSSFKTKTGIFSFYENNTSGKAVVMATALRVSFCFFCDTHLWCQVSRTLL